MLRDIADLKRIDWNFHNDDTRYLTHPIHRYSSKFPPQIASNLIKKLTVEGECVIDNFVGSGTSLVEANLLKRHSVGIDLNPIACIISKAKVTSIPSQRLKTASKMLLGEVARRIVRGQQTLTEQSTQAQAVFSSFHPKIRDWYFESDIQELLAIKKSILSVEDDALRRIGLVSFSGILRRCSKANSSYANIMKDKNAKPKRKAYREFRRQFMFNVNRIMEFNTRYDPYYAPEVVLGDARSLGFLRDETFDLIISHPPYAGAIPYAEFQMLSLLWLGHDPRHLDKTLIGGRRRSKDIIERFFQDMKQVFAEMYRVLRPGRYCCVVIGNPVVFGEVIQLNRMLTNVANDKGFEFALELNRERINMRKGKLRKEYILLFQKH